METEESQRIVSAIQDIIIEVAPDAKEKSMYGGLVYELDNTSPKRLFCGVFARKNYVTVEFDRGTELKEEEKFLEGSGKDRRHLTIHSLDDITTKNVKGYIEQSYSLPA